MTKNPFLKVLGIVLLVVATTLVTLQLKGAAGQGFGGTTNFDDLGLSTLTVTGTSTLGGINTSGTLTVTGANGLRVGGTAVYNAVTLLAAATTSVPLFILAPNTSATSSALTTFTIPVGGITAGDPCTVGLTTAPSSQFGADTNITTSSASSATGTITWWNGTSTAVTVATGTARVACIHLAI